jgi:predicted RNase H-like HicB family nuclease
MDADVKTRNRLPYGRVWEWRKDDEDAYWLVRLADIPEVVGDGATREEAEAALRMCFEEYVAWRAEEAEPDDVQTE